jgi:rhodanese-related sulfurtransferase
MRSIVLWFLQTLMLLQLMTGAAIADESEEGGGAILLKPAKPYLHVIHNDRSIKVQRVQDPDYTMHGYFAKTARKCPPFCIQPIKVAPEVATIGELEIFDFMENQLREGTGLLIDARTPEWYNRGTIPGSINIPFTRFSVEADSKEMAELLQSFGAVRRGDVGFVSRKLEEFGVLETSLKTDKWDFTQAKDIVLWCNGPACGQSPRAIQGLLGVGYPPDKLFYFRGGMQMWQLWGLTTVTSDK